VHCGHVSLGCSDQGLVTGGGDGQIDCLLCLITQFLMETPETTMAEPLSTTMLRPAQSSMTFFDALPSRRRAVSGQSMFSIRALFTQ